MRWKTFPILAILMSALGAAPGFTHQVKQPAPRELIRIQGYRTETAPPETKRRLVLVAMGANHAFAATDWQVFGFSEDSAKPGTDVSPAQRFTLQAAREDLARFAGARPEQRITLLVERRPGSADLFVLALDLCPSR